MKKIFTVILLSSLLSLFGCSGTTLNAPCPNFGANCSKAPINSWDYTR